MSNHAPIASHPRPPLVLHFFGVSGLGGSELGALALIHRQPQFQHHVLFLEPPGPAGELYARAGIANASLALGRGGPLQAVLRLRAHLARVHPDLIVAYGLRPSLLVRLLAHRPALVQAIHSVDAHRPVWQAFLDRRTAGRVDRYITNSDAGARFLITERGVSAARIRVVPNGIEIEPFAAAAAGRAAARDALGLDERTPVILTVANLRAPKGLDTLVETAAHLRPATFVWLVAGDGPLAAALVHDLERRRLGDQVRLLGFRGDIPNLLAAADLFCLTSRREGVPISILEAMAAGRAVVATDVGGIRELVAEGETGLLVPPADPEALAGVLTALLADPEGRARLGAAGQARARTRHPIGGAAAAMAAVYDEVIVESKR